MDCIKTRLGLVVMLWLCRRSALFALSLGVIGTNRSSACITRQPTAEVHVGPFGLKVDDD